MIDKSAAGVTQWTRPFSWWYTAHMSALQELHICKTPILPPEYQLQITILYF
jgi:hypothetical protein